MVCIYESRKNACYHCRMGTINQQSVREEAERIKTEFDRLSVDKKINSETKMLIRSMFMLINLLIAIFLEKTTKGSSQKTEKIVR
jgi:transposase